MVIQIYCKEESFYRTSRGKGILPVMADKIYISMVRLAYCVNPGGFSSQYLTGAEQRELAAFRFPQKKFQWLAARVVTKGMYSRYLKKQGRLLLPNQVPIKKIDAGPMRGKPLVDIAGSVLGDISLSHAGSLAVCALVNSGRVGIDIEPMESPAPLFIKTVYTAQELKALNDVPGRLTLAERVKLLWVMKESLLKALGVGFYYGLGSVRLREYNDVGPVFSFIPELSELSGSTVKMTYGFFNHYVFCITVLS